MKKEKKEKLKELLYRLKSPLFFIPFAITWLLLESPTIFGVVAYWITGNEKWWALAGSWIALTAAPLPIPVLGISITVAATFEGIIHRRRKKRNGNMDEDKKL